MKKYIFQEDITEQNKFCNYKNLYFNSIFDESIRLTNVKFYNKEFKMNVYRRNDVVSNNILRTKTWESLTTKNILNALFYYTKKYNLSNNDSYIIDIGANVGWFSFFLSKYKYKIIAFEPSQLNYYILRKNFCINRDSNIILINKGLYTEDKKCDLYNLKGNIGNGMIICDNVNKTSSLKNLFKTGEIVLTKLSNYIPLIKNNLVLIKK